MIVFNFSPFPDLQLHNYYLRKITPEDVSELNVLRSNSELMQYIPVPIHQNKVETLELIQNFDRFITSNTGVNWGIVLKDTTKIIGTIGFYNLQPEKNRGEIGFLLHPNYHGQGIITTIVKYLINYGFETIGFSEIEANLNPKNKACIKVLEKCNFSLVEAMHYHDFKEKDLECITYCIRNPKANK